jgi:ribosomal protein L29
MKRNDIQALQSKTVAELHKQLDELKGTLAMARMEKASRKPLTNGSPSVIGDDIARVKQALAAKEQAEKLEKEAAKTTKAAAKEEAKTETTETNKK